MDILIDHKILTIDDEDYETYLKYKWVLATNPAGQFYLRTRIKNAYNKGIFHRIITNCPIDMMVDHINGNSLDNRKCNLRICTNAQNLYNQKKRKRQSHSRFKGVTFRKDLKSKPWEAFIYANGKSKRLGYFATEIEAAKAYNEAAKEAYGEYAKLNEL